MPDNLYHADAALRIKLRDDGYFVIVVGDVARPDLGTTRLRNMADQMLRRYEQQAADGQPLAGFWVDEAGIEATYAAEDIQKRQQAAEIELLKQRIDAMTTTSKAGAKGAAVTNPRAQRQHETRLVVTQNYLLAVWDETPEKTLKQWANFLYGDGEEEKVCTECKGWEAIYKDLQLLRKEDLIPRQNETIEAWGRRRSAAQKMALKRFRR